MPKMFSALSVAFALAFSVSATAQTVVTDAWARATVPAQKTGGAYLTLRSPDAAKVVGASSPAAASVELHTMQMNGSTMSMREMPAIVLPAGKAVSDFHVMLLGLKQALHEGETVPLELKVERAGAKPEIVKVAVPVKALTYSAAAH